MDTTTRRGRSPGSRSERLKQISKSSSQIVKDAAALLDDEVAAGILAAKRVQQRFQKSHRIDPGDFKDVLQKFQGNAHEVVSMLDDQIDGLGSKEGKDLSKRFLNHAHEVVDLAVELVNTGAELADQLGQSKLKRDRKNRGKRSR